MVEVISPVALTADLDNLGENCHSLDTSLLPTVNYVGTTDLLILDEPLSKADGVTMLREHLGLGDNESIKLQKA